MLKRIFRKLRAERQWVFSGLGTSVSLTILGIAFGVLWYIGQEAGYKLGLRSVPDDGRFSVIVADLENDSGGYTDLVVDSLTSLEGLITVARLGRTISTAGELPAQAVQRGHEVAEEYLSAMAGSVMLWGRVVGGDKIRLRWTVSSRAVAARGSCRYASSELELPSRFGMGQILGLLVHVQASDLLHRSDEIDRSRLASFAQRVGSLLAEPSRALWSEPARLALKLLLGDAMLLLGNASHDKTQLEGAVKLYRETLETDRRPDTYHQLGTALLVLGKLGPGLGVLNRALEALDQAEILTDREEKPDRWATTAAHRAAALLAIGSRSLDTTKLLEAEHILRRTLASLPTSSPPLHVAEIKSGLGATLLQLDSVESANDRADSASVLLAEAVRVFDRLGVRGPVRATAGTNLGKALAARHHYTSARSEYRRALASVASTDRRTIAYVMAAEIDLMYKKGNNEESANAYRDLLDDYDQDTLGPELYHSVSLRLAKALRRIGVDRMDPSYLIQAESYARTARAAWRGAPGARLRWALAAEELGRILSEHGELEYDRARIREAIKILGEANRVLRQDRPAMSSTEPARSLAWAYIARATVERDATSATRAVEILRGMQSELEASSETTSSDTVDAGLGAALLLLGQLTGDQMAFLEAAERTRAYAKSIDRSSRGDWILAQRNLAWCLASAGSALDEPEMLHEGLRVTENLQTETRPPASSPEWFDQIELQSLVLRQIGVFETAPSRLREAIHLQETLLARISSVRSLGQQRRIMMNHAETLRFLAGFEPEAIHYSRAINAAKRAVRLSSGDQPEATARANVLLGELLLESYNNLGHQEHSCEAASAFQSALLAIGTDGNDQRYFGARALWSAAAEACNALRET